MGAVMNLQGWILGLSATAASLGLASAQQIPDPLANQEEIVRRTSNTWNKPFHFPQKVPEVTASIIEYPPGAGGLRHTSPYSRYIYVLEGTLTFDLGGGSLVDFQAGSLILSGSTWLTLKNNGVVPAKALVIDQTEVGESNSVPK
ncbi:MAG: cupin domain-containing protein [Hyphomicrobiales bacterium]